MLERDREIPSARISSPPSPPGKERGGIPNMRKQIFEDAYANHAFSLSTTACPHLPFLLISFSSVRRDGGYDDRTSVYYAV